MYGSIKNNNNREQDFRVFLNTLQNATTNIGNDYFLLDVAEKDETIYRERVYCYELYRHIHNLLPIGFNYHVDGELDKSGHPLIENIAGPIKPDFLVHERGTMSKNLIVMEVKPITFSNRGLIKDLKTLITLTSQKVYDKAILLIYGYDEKRINNVTSKIMKQTEFLPTNCFYFLVHKEPLSMAEVIYRN